MTGSSPARPPRRRHPLPESSSARSSGSTRLLKAALTIALPLIALAAGLGFLRLLPASGAISAANAGDPPAIRIGGYNVGETKSYWDTLSGNGVLASERLLLVSDLAFPLVYGGAFAMAFVTAWMMLGRPVHIGWLLSPVVIVVAADWTENLVLLAQLDAFETNRESLSAGWFGVASLATTIKLGAVAVCSILTLGLAFCLARQA